MGKSIRSKSKKKFRTVKRDALEPQEIEKAERLSNRIVESARMQGANIPAEGEKMEDDAKPVIKIPKLKNKIQKKKKTKRFQFHKK
mmetsp:Transcript_26912/g.46384  ORF Transcript_26912/g.46384 Transcript_26912/m.46384 type:complete len:86 (-) Transcript_26912:256-513(-)